MVIQPPLEPSHPHFPSHPLGHHRTPDQAPCGTQQLLTTCPLYTHACMLMLPSLLVPFTPSHCAYKLISHLHLSRGRDICIVMTDSCYCTTETYTVRKKYLKKKKKKTSHKIRLNNVTVMIGHHLPFCYFMVGGLVAKCV